MLSIWCRVDGALRQQEIDRSNKSNNLRILNNEFWKPNVEKQKYDSHSSIGETAWPVSISKIDGSLN